MFRPQCHTTFPLYRHLYLSLILILAYILPPAPAPPPSLVSRLAPILADTSTKQEVLLHRLRTAAIQRPAIMRDAEFRESVRLCCPSWVHVRPSRANIRTATDLPQIMSFWEATGREAEWAAADGGVGEVKRRFGLHEGGANRRDVERRLADVLRGVEEEFGWGVETERIRGFTPVV